MRSKVAILTGGGDKPYALGVAACLITAGVPFDFIGSNEVDSPFLHESPLVRYLNLRGDQRTTASRTEKVSRILRYYCRLLGFAVSSKATVFHILWNNKFEYFDRTVLLVFYRLLGKRIVLTAHNVNIRKRDGNDSRINRATLKFQYSISSHIFVHTEKMKRELLDSFAVSESKITVIPFGLNSTVPDTDLLPSQAKHGLGLDASHKVLLFFGNIAPYKGLEYLIDGLAILIRTDPSYRLLIAGRAKDCQPYLEGIRKKINELKVTRFIIERIEYIPDEETEIYFKAADLLVLPYLEIFQSGVLSVGYNFGLPVVVTDVGSLQEEVVAGKTGYTCRPKDGADLASAITRFFESRLFSDLEATRKSVRKYARERYSWETVGKLTSAVYSSLEGRPQSDPAHC